MCLDIVSREKPKPTGTGWKVFQRHVCTRKLVSSIMRSLNHVFVVGKWYQAQYSPRTPKPSRFIRYSPGFHIFLKKEDAVRYAKSCREVLRKVRYRGAHTLGSGVSGLCAGPQVVADSIKIVPIKRKRKRP